MLVGKANRTTESVSDQGFSEAARECPGAARNVGRLVGTPVAALRENVLEMLPGTLGCTHLNDVLRALADVPKLAEALR